MSQSSTALPTTDFERAAAANSECAVPDSSATTPVAGLVGRWRELQNVHAAVSGALEKELQGRHRIGASEFEVLDRLVDAACASYRMSELAGDIHLSQSALSRAVARLERDGLVHRDMCTDDRRAIFVCLTDTGRAVHAAAAATHREVLARLLH